MNVQLREVYPWWIISLDEERYLREEAQSPPPRDRGGNNKSRRERAGARARRFTVRFGKSRARGENGVRRKTREIVAGNATCLFPRVFTDARAFSHVGEAFFVNARTNERERENIAYARIHYSSAIARSARRNRRSMS